MLQVHPVPAFSDNYLWVIHNGRNAVAVDPGDASPVIDFLTAQNLTLSGILCTHHHADHVGGVEAMLDFLDLRGQIPVYGPAGEKIPARTMALKEGERVVLPGVELELNVLDVPGHTAGHIAYVGQDMLFCGDTLFACGCGRLFEGTAAQMTKSLAKLKELPGHTRVYCAHEYTMSNIRFAEAVEPDNADLKLRKAFCAAKRHRNQPTLPSTIALELATNPFLRWDSPAVVAAAEGRAGRALRANHEIFASIREWKNNF
ncbi:MAG: hydroxyacylglutathione hydrolase [Betaproteobacteria bacterium]|nr:hydroxyacylglutathione hydrolase [Betaproteobacteria bacterium]